MTFEYWWAINLPKINLTHPPSPDVECQAKQIARAAWNGALDAASRLKNPAYTTDDLARRLQELHA